MAPRRGNERKEKGKMHTPSDGLQEALLRNEDLSEDFLQDQFPLPPQQGASLDPSGAPCQATPSRSQLEGYIPPQISIMPGNGTTVWPDSHTRHPVPTQPCSTGSVCILAVLERVPKNSQGLVPICESGGARGVEAVGEVLGEDVRSALHASGFRSLLQLLPPCAGGQTSADGSEGSERAAFDGSGSRCAVAGGCSDRREAGSHRDLRNLMTCTPLEQYGIAPGTRVALLIPNGPEFASCVLLLLARATCVPLNHQQTLAELRGELVATRCTVLITLAGGAGGAGWHAADAAALAREPSMRLQHLELLPDARTAGMFSLRRASCPAGGAPEAPEAPQGGGLGASVASAPWNAPGDVALVLHTSGTSGSKKRVPYTLESLVVGAACIIHSWKLSPNDVCLNMMPLFHVGGISRNLLATVLAGAGVVCAPAFDPGAFWETLEAKGVTWYYAGPTMHHMILEEGRARGILPPTGAHGDSSPGFLDTRDDSSSPTFPKAHSVVQLQDFPGACATLGKQKQRRMLRMVANASGGLVPALAGDVRAAFGCSVLPSYGMTECMPISSPPLGYLLDRPGSSGRVCGPRVRIRGGGAEGWADGVGAGGGAWLGVGEVGGIWIKGSPVMEGYEVGECGERAGLEDGGWFDTGDMGYLDKDGWIYVTGRSKEVINRGGEIISPFEVEEACLAHPKVATCIAFSCPHPVLQEVVGLAMVGVAGVPRVDLLGIQRFVSARLHQAKWPQVLVFMDDLPMGQANKAQRVRLAERLSLTAVDDRAPQVLRMFEATCPPRGSPLSTPVERRPLTLDPQQIMGAIEAERSALGVEASLMVSFAHGGASGALVLYVSPQLVDSVAVMAALALRVHAYNLPLDIIALPSIPSDHSLLPPPSLRRDWSNPGQTANSGGGDGAPNTDTERVVLAVWEEVLGVCPIRRDEDFFALGGTSLLAGRVIAGVRKALGVPMTAAAIFGSRTVEALAASADALLEEARQQEDEDCFSGDESMDESTHAFPGLDAGGSGAGRGDVGAIQGGGGRRGRRGGMFSEVKYQARMHPLSSTSPAALFVQALPLVLLYPLRRVLTWITFVAYWIIIQRFSSLSRLQALLSALALERFTAGVLLPLVAVLAKWTVIGRYKAGAHQLWGSYYLRWWIVDQTLQVCGRGVFRHSGRSLIWYYRLLGAKIGRDVSIHPSARFAEHDLLTIGDGSAIDNVSVRAFTLGAGAMRLEPLTLGKSVTVAAKVALVPGMPVPDYSVLAPLSSSYDLPAPARTDLPPRLPPPGLPAGAGQCTMRFPAPGIGYRALGYAILLGVCLLEQLPVLLVLRAMVDSPWYIPHLSNVREVIVWFLTPQRIGYYLALRVVRAVVLPIVRLGACIAVKRLIIGKFTEGRRDRSEWNLFKHWLMASLLPGEALQDVGHLVGAHYEGMTLILRLLGAKVGERVYWPGSSFEGLVEYDLLEVGDDCVFGSRSIIRCADATHAARVTVCKGANVGDRCVLLPGSTVGVNAVLGSGGILQKGSVMAPGSMHVGSYRGRAVVLDEGDVAAADAPTLKPFGSAFYLGNAPYFVIPGWMHGLIGALARSWAVVHRALTLSLSLFATASLLGGVESPDFLGASRLALFVRFLLMFIVIQNAATVVAVGAAIVLKWGLMGRRTVGDHSWDRSPFCQRWQVYLASTVIIRHAYYGRGILEYLHGSAYLVWYFRALGCHIGRDVCLYPTGADPMMTEPDLVQIGDEACVDDASLIAHINSRGRFSLNRVVVGPGATLRAFSRLLSGAAMMPRATVLEHTLVLGGDVVDEDSIWQGWPGREIAKATPVQVQVPSDGGAVRDVGVKGEEIWATLPMRWLGRSRRRARATPSARWARLVQAGDGNAAQLDDIGWGREVR